MDVVPESRYTVADVEEEDRANAGGELVGALNASRSEQQPLTGRKSGYGTVAEVLAESDVYLKYFWKILLLIGLYYLVPSMQFVAFQTNAEVDCYYNFACKRDLNGIEAFNNIISNIMYFALGLVFLAYVYLTRPTEQSGFGLHTDVSLFYSLGIVLCFEGIFSALYHVCPSRLNFQFDTTFMITGIALVFVAVFSKRHASRTIGAVRFYAWVSILIFVNSLTLISGRISAFVWVIVFTVLIYVLVAGSLHIYFHKKWSLDRGTLSRAWARARTCDIEDKPRFFTLMLANTLTLSLAIYGATQVTQFADYLLSVFLLNLVIYMAYYIWMKWSCKEPIHWMVPLLLVVITVLMVVSMVFFTIPVTDKLLTPEESRELNKPCVLFDYFDTHDVWHFTSACGIFVLLMLLYRLDRGLENTARSQIVVF